MDTTRETPVRRRLTAEHGVIALLTCVGLFVGARPLDDNSMLVHLRTGLEIWDSGSIASTDPYSFTATGSSWVVQSWLASLLYGALHAVGGWKLVVVLNMVLAATVAFVTMLLARSGTMIRTAAAGGIALGIGLPLWSSRPLLFAFAAFALTVLVVERRRSPWWLLPIVAVWVSTHGSFPIGFAVVALIAIGDCIDRRAWSWRSCRYAGVFLLGVLAGGINPVGPQLLTFWTKALTQDSSVFVEIAEWSSPDFHQGLGVVLLVALTLAVLVLTRGRLPWRYVLPVVVLLAASLWAVRNFAFLSVAIAPALAYVLQTKATDEDESRLLPVVAAVTSAVFAIGLFVWVAGRPAFDFARYPVSKLDAVADADRILTPDWVGGYRIFQDGAEAHVFIDDRYDLYPAQVADDYAVLLTGEGEFAPIFDRYDFDAVVWPTESPLGNYVAADGRWTLVAADDTWSAYRLAQ